MARPEKWLEGTRRDYNRMIEKIGEGVVRILETLAAQGLYGQKGRVPQWRYVNRYSFQDTV